MVGIVIVSHSKMLAGGVLDIVTRIAPDAPVAAAGGTADGGFGTDYDLIADAVESVYSKDGVVMLFDMGSAIMTAEKVIAQKKEYNIRMLDCPLVEGAIAASVVADSGGSMLDVIRATETIINTRKF